jgi:hypothetical protein
MSLAPCCNFGVEDFVITNAPIEALPAQHTNSFKRLARFRAYRMFITDAPAVEENGDRRRGL